MTPEDRLRQMIEAARDTGGDRGGWPDFAARAHRALFMRRVALASGAVALIAVGAFSAAVVAGDGAPDVATPAERPSESAHASVEPAPPDTSPTSEPSPTEAASPAEVSPFEAELWFVSGEHLSFGTMIVPLTEGDLWTRLPEGSAAQRAAVATEALLTGVPGPFAELGDVTAIPEGTQLLDVRVAEGTAIVDLNDEFESGGGSLSMQLRVAQIVYTVTQVEGINGVRFAIEGREVESIGGEGLVVDGPLDRSDFDDVAPPIVMITPKINSTHSDSVVVTGRANVFEGNVSIRLMGEDGELLKETFTTATCGSGCWGEFSKRIGFSVDHAQEGRMEVLSYSAEDGSRQDVISVPVTLSP